jgi:broad specificity phosphatase PhoE
MQEAPNLRSAQEILKGVEVTFIRHAESSANANHGQHFGSNAQLQLSEKGMRQAEELVEKLAPADLVIVSRYDRTLLTATPYLKSHPEIPVASSPLLHEFNYLHPKRFESKRPEGERHPTDVYWENLDINFSDRGFAENPQDLESFKEFATRVHKFAMSLKEIIAQHPANKKIKIFTHGLFIKTMYLLLTEFPDVFSEKTPADEVDKRLKQLMARVGEMRQGEDMTPNASIHRQFNSLLADYWDR